jgi:hypothetical protein
MSDITKNLLKLLMAFLEVITVTGFVISAVILAFISSMIAYRILTNGICHS